MPSNEIENKINELINKHNYKVTAALDENEDLKVDFAGRETVTYHIVQDEQSEVYGVAIEYSGTEEFIPLKAVLTRLFIIADIFRRCRRLDISPNVIRYYKEGNEVKFVDLVQVQLTKDDQQLEITLDGYIEKILAGKPIDYFDDKVAKLGMLYNFSLLKGLLL